MDKDLKQEIAGKGQNLKGRIKEVAGALSGNKHTQAEGVVDRVAGAAREKIGEVKHDLNKGEHRRQEEETDDE